MKIKTGGLRFQKGFTLVELLTVVAIIGMTVGVGIVMVASGSVGTDRRASAEIVMQDLRKVYSLADDAKRYGPAGGQQRDRYKIVFHDEKGTPKNAYVIMRYWNEAKNIFEWNEVPPDRKEVNRIVTGTNWIRPSSNPDIWIGLPEGVANGEYEIVFISKGSIMTVETVPPGARKEVKIVTHSKNQSSTIDISDYGDISSS